MVIQRLSLPFFALSFCLLFASCIIENPKPEDCEMVQIKVVRISEGGVKDIVFHNAGKDKFYYINRGLEHGLILDSLKTKVLNKTVTLHVVKVLGGATTNHIAQLALDDEVIYSEFN